MVFHPIRLRALFQSAATFPGIDSPNLGSEILCTCTHAILSAACCQLLNVLGADAGLENPINKTALQPHVQATLARLLPL